ncbi:MAG: hypothetical protein A3B11_00025 [Candidatus Taylorbacteria bacterium RIFCSPLOWO2_01_FULL_44_26]|uniref:Uncharacterized protein n=2 Tax=Candidatus Tayloriibacteriota TaxID=1817919 RepID=A0A1G2MKY4_9BACT|nr:MAG: hypothetical protein A3D50_01665 [Candidatus Taylorbacteria bacterium RIFCSPHIGHO2_02_FULL_44_12]OHA31082.1 MAG: hypothetical protein A3B11_00025 [Candidatus Taylorbacteria bacterium RIFCSPLOWO2_01_FULL_44_26]
MLPHSLLSAHFRLNLSQKIALKRLGINTAGDLLCHFPVRYGDTVEVFNIANLSAGQSAVVFGKISSLKASKGFRSRVAMADGFVSDETGRIHCVWFNQPYLAKMIPNGSLVRIEGKVSERKNKNERYFSNPKIEVVEKIPIGVGHSLFGNNGDFHGLYPLYSESRGITSNWIYHKIAEILKSGILEDLPDPIPTDILEKYHLPSIKTAIVWIHAPQKREYAEAARKRFAFQEIFFIQLSRQRAKLAYRRNHAFVIEPARSAVEKFIDRFPFQATQAQLNAIENILADFTKDQAMTRLLEGDVGSGKTAVAATTAFAVVGARPQGQSYGNLQVAYMCPTEILAIQHFESFINYFSHLPIAIGLITSSGCRKFPAKAKTSNKNGWTEISKKQLLKWTANGEIPILIGTHALIQKSVTFKHLAYVIIDEQHRFGTIQRARLVAKNSAHAKGYDIAPHFLSMTATPIPRTLALTLYGDLDLTLLDQSPAGRKTVITELVYPSKRAETYERIRQELRAGRQMFVICPRIDEPDPDKQASLNAKSVKQEAKRLKKDIFPEYNIAIIHSRMKPAEKDAVMRDFKDGKTHILCSTSVVEVGVNVPNATVIIIEGAERFGLAQLHQLRGRVLRSSHQAYCYTFSETVSRKSVERLRALQTAKNGFELAELDLQQRGAGELSGIRQWGISDIAMDALKNLKMVEAARAEATRIVSEDFELTKYPLLKAVVKLKETEIHHE